MEAASVTSRGSSTRRSAYCCFRVCSSGGLGGLPAGGEYMVAALEVLAGKFEAQAPFGSGDESAHVLF